MPSHKPVKTYEKRTRAQLNKSTKSAEAINALFAQNLKQRLKCRRKAKLKVKELPPRTAEYLTDDSLKVTPNNTFDRLLRGKVYNPVKVCKLVKINSSSDATKSISFHSPIMTRTRSGTRLVVSEVSEKSQQTSVLENNSKKVSVDKDLITKSISVEKEQKKPNFSSLSYIQLPKITENEVSTDQPYRPLFSETFRERQVVHSSTPAIPPTQKIVADSISPIIKSDSSNSSKLIEKSYDHIRKWDDNFPKEDTPKRRSTRKTDTKGRRRKILTASPRSRDWKLQISPKVYLRNFDRRKSSEGRSTELRGFTEEEQSSSWEESNRLQSFFNSASLDYGKAKRKFPSFKCDRRITIRRKSVGKVPRKSSNKKTPDRRSTNVAKGVKTRATIHSGVESQRRTVTSLRSRRTIQSTRTKTSARIEGRNSKKLVVILSPIRSEAKSRTSSASKVDSRSSSSSHCYFTRRRTKVKSNGSSASQDPSSERRTNLKSRSSSRGESSGRRTNLKSRSSSASQLDSSISERKTRLQSRISVPQPAPSNRTSRRRTNLRSSVAQLDSSTDAGETKPKISLRRATRSKRTRLSSSTPIPKRSLRSRTKKTNLKKDSNEVQSTSFDFSSEKEATLEEEPEVSKPGLTVDLQEFDNFVHGGYTSPQSNAKNVSVITVSDDSVFAPSPFKSPYPKSHTSHLQYATPLKTPKTNPDSKIIILSNISLGRGVHSCIDALRKINHDHSYTSPVVQTPPRLHSTPRLRATPRQSPRKSQNLSNVNETSIVDEDKFIAPKTPVFKHILLKPGKSYRRSLSLLRRSSVLVDLPKRGCPIDCRCANCVVRKKFDWDVSRRSQIVPVAKKPSRLSLLDSYARTSVCYVQGEDLLENLDDSVRSLTLNARSSIGKSLQVTARDVVLRRCGQTEVLRFDECYPPSALQNCQKIGEGVYGEVFLYRNPNGGTSVMKIIPIEGDLIVNGERQKKFEEILSEIVISMELSNLRNNKKNTTTSYSEVQKVRCLQGNYPDRLLDLWDLYDETRGSENDSPQMFPSDQMYIVLELANGGKDLEGFVFNNAVQAFAMFKQTACALAVAESQLKFEHRDLHWGNVLVSGCDKNQTLTYRVNGKEIEVESTGVEIAIIDFTLSRIEFDGVVIFNDLSLDNELFAAKGDYQFEIYRLMQKGNGNEWQHFQPYSNVLWLHYLLDKVPILRYKNVKSKVHKEYLEKLNNMKDEILSYKSVTEFIEDFF